MQQERAPLNVLITIDAELWPISGTRMMRPFADSYREHILGQTSEGEYGVRFQLDTFARCGLRAVYFVEALSAELTGDAMLRDVVDLIQKHPAPQDVQLHLHPEWLGRMRDPIVPPCGPNFHALSHEDQVTLLRHGIDALHRAGVEKITAFRAGNFAATRTSLAAVAEAGLKFDSSYNQLRRPPESDFGPDLYQPRNINNVWEFPVSVFRDFPNHFRPAQVCACSAYEMKVALNRAWEAGWSWFVMVLHSFELVSDRRTERPRPNRRVIDRFQSICEYLESNHDRFQTRTMSDITDMAEVANVQPITSSLSATCARYAEQVSARLKSRLKQALAAT